MEPTGLAARDTDGRSESETEAEAAARDRVRTLGLRRRLGAGAGVLAVALAAYGIATGPTGEPLVGRSDVASGMSSTAPPPAGLSLSWTRPLLGGVPDFADMLLRWTPASATDERALVAGAVIDLRSGDVLSRRTDLAGTKLGRQHVGVSEGELVVSDSMTGAVLTRATLSPEVMAFGQVRYPFARHAGVTALSNDENVLLVRDDGTLLRALPGMTPHHAARVRPGSPYAVLRDDGTAVVEVVEVLTGDVVHTVFDGDAPGDPLVAVDVADGTLVSSELVRRAMPSDDPTSWGVRIVDLAGEADQMEFTIEAQEAPTLLGILSNGAVTLGITMDERTFALPVLGGEMLASVSAVRPRSTVTGLEDLASTAASAVLGLHGDLVISLDEMETITAMNAIDGTVVWAWGVEGAREVRVFDGVVAVGTVGSTDDFSAGPITLFDADDGIELATVQPPQWLYGAIVAGGDGTVGVAPDSMRSERRAVPLSSVVWTQVEDGAPSTAAAAFGPWLDAMLVGSTDAPERPDVVADLEDGLLAGTIADGKLLRPIVVQTPDAGLLRILWSDGRFLDVNLDVNLGGDPSGSPSAGVSGESGTSSYYGYFADVRGVAGRQLVAHRTAPDNSFELVLVDLDDGSVQAVAGYSPSTMLGSLLLAENWSSEGDQLVQVVDPVAASIRWQLAPPGRTPEVAADDGLLVVVDPWNVRGLASADGALLWGVEPDVLLGRGVVVTERHVVVTSVMGDVIALDRVTGEEAWRSSAAGLEVAVIVGAGSHVLLGTVDGRVVHLDDTGAVLDDVRALAGPVRDVSVHGDTVVVLGHDRVVGLQRGGDGFSELDEVGR